MAIQLGKRILADVMNVHVFDNVTGKHMMTEEDLTTGDLEFDVTTKEVRGGQGNPVICILSSGRKVTVKTANPVMDLQNIATQLGTTIVTGENVGYTSRNKLKIAINGSSVATIVLPKTPITPANLKLSYKGTDLVVATDYTIGTDKRTITILTVGVILNEVIVVESYDYKTSATARTINIDAESYPKGVRIVCETFLIDTGTNKKETLKMIFPKAIPTGKFTMATKSEVDASSTALEYTVMKPDDDDIMGYMLIEDYDSIFDPLTPATTPITDLSATGGTVKADLTFSPSALATSVTLKYKISTDTVYSDIATSGSTGARIASALTSASTSASVLGLTATTSYQFKLVVVGGTNAGESNIVTATTL